MCEKRSDGLLSLFSSRRFSAKVVALAIAQAGVQTALTSETAAAEVRDSVTTHEASVVIGGTSYRQVRFEGHDYFLKDARPGSVLVEVRCQRPSATPAEEDAPTAVRSATTPADATATTARSADATPAPLAVASRSRAFVDKLQDGCAPKEGLPPERFTFEQRENRAAKASQDAAKPKRKVELLGPKSFPDDLDPHVLPEPPPAGGNFERSEKRY